MLGLSISCRGERIYAIVDGTVVGEKDIVFPPSELEVYGPGSIYLGSLLIEGKSASELHIRHFTALGDELNAQAVGPGQIKESRAYPPLMLSGIEYNHI
jgi:hypothetical protein